MPDQVHIMPFLSVTFALCDAELKAPFIFPQQPEKQRGNEKTQNMKLFYRVSLIRQITYFHFLPGRTDLIKKQE